VAISNFRASTLLCIQQIIPYYALFVARISKALAPTPEHFVEVDLTLRDDDLARKMRSKLVGEIPELKGLNTRDAEGIKTFISRTFEEWVGKWREFAGRYLRRLVFIGTTNADRFLTDDTGNRRWLPVTVGSIDVAAIERDRDQLWAEARHMFRGQWMGQENVDEGPPAGIRWEAAEHRAREVHAEYFRHDEWEPPYRAMARGVVHRHAWRPSEWGRAVHVAASAARRLGVSRQPSERRDRAPPRWPKG
jgi:hypothetical protein